MDDPPPPPLGAAYVASLAGLPFTTIAVTLETPDKSSAIKDARTERVDSLYIGNMLSGELTGQEHLGALISDFVGLRGVEAVKIEAACGSGAAALRIGYIAVAGELADFVVVAGVVVAKAKALQKLETGQVRQYAAIIAAGVLALLVFLSFFTTSSFIVHAMGLTAFLVMFVPFYERANIARFLRKEEKAVASLAGR